MSRDAAELWDLITDGMRKRSVIEASYTFPEEHKISASDLAAIEKALGGMIFAIMKAIVEAGGGELSEDQLRFTLDAANITKRNDGKDNVVYVTLDFAEILAPITGASEIAEGSDG